ncbi:MAG: hypothetical protein ACP5SH_18275 [Syntrophobacteraceae bacterium]
MPDPHNSHLIPLTIAVTGHRDIHPADEEAIKSFLQKRFLELRQKYKNTPLLALSGLAAGADMIFAEAALDMGIEVVPVLPAGPDVFALDFKGKTGTDRDKGALEKRFRKLLEQCSDPVIVAENFERDDPARYERVGSYLLRHSQILFALWDGLPSESTGGTAWVVETARNGNYDFSWEVSRDGEGKPRRSLYTPEPMEVHHLLVSRGDRAPFGFMRWQSDEPGDKKTSESCLNNTKAIVVLDRFNRDASRLRSKNPAVVEAYRKWMGLDPDAAPADTSFISKSENRMLEVLAAAGTLAVALRNRSKFTLGMISWIALLVVASFEYYSNIQHHWLFLVLYLGGMLAGVVVYLLDRCRRTYARYVDYRGLAEGLRVLLFWRLSGLPNSAADHYLRKQRNEIAWIRRALYTLNVGARRTSPRFDLVKKYWIEDQAGYFDESSPRDKKSHDLYMLLATCCFFAGLALAAAVLAIELTAWAPMRASFWMNRLILSAGLLPAGAAILRGYADRRGFAQQAKRYAQMRDLFQAADSRFNPFDEKSRPDHLKLLFELGEEALSENGDWILLHRERPIPSHLQ